MPDWDLQERDTGRKESRRGNGIIEILFLAPPSGGRALSVGFPDTGSRSRARHAANFGLLRPSLFATWRRRPLVRNAGVKECLDVVIGRSSGW